MNASTIKYITVKARTRIDHIIKIIETWDARALLQSRKVDNLKIEMEILQTDILAVSQIWDGQKSEDFRSREYQVIYSGMEEGKTWMKGLISIVLQKNMWTKSKMICAM